MPSDLLTWQPMDPNELSGSTHSLDRDSLSSFATTSSIAPPYTPTPSLHDQSPANASGQAPLPSSSEDHAPEQLPEGVTQQEKEVPVVSEEASHEQAEKPPIPEIVLDEETPPAGEEGVTHEKPETVENEATAEGKTTPDSELEGNSADKEPLLHIEEEKEEERERGKGVGKETDCLCMSHFISVFIYMLCLCCCVTYVLTLEVYSELKLYSILFVQMTIP